MSAGKRTCTKCGVEFLLTRDKSGYVDVCPNCSVPTPEFRLEAISNIRGEIADIARLDGKSEAEVEALISGEGYRDWALKRVAQYLPGGNDSVRKIQQLVYDKTTKRLYCPNHPFNTLKESITNTGYSMVCILPRSEIRKLPCMNSAEWPSREDMERDLASSQ